MINFSIIAAVLCHRRGFEPNPYRAIRMEHPMLANKAGRDVLAKALVAGAAAAVLVEDRKDVADAAKTTERTGVELVAAF
ncbi:hypothetical protein C3Y89_05025 [Rhizobium sp. UPM1132]|nr:hypothetical protein [Rhizobium ruizarguesonis]